MVSAVTMAIRNDWLVPAGQVFQSMMNTSSGDPIASHQNRERVWFYSLEVIGRIPETQKGRLHGLQVSKVEKTGSGEITTLEGRLEPGATLADVYDILTELGLRVKFEGGYY